MILYVSQLLHGEGSADNDEACRKDEQNANVFFHVMSPFRLVSGAAKSRANASGLSGAKTLRQVKRD